MLVTATAVIYKSAWRKLWTLRRILGVKIFVKGWVNDEECTSQQILDTNHKKIYNKKLSVSQISVRNATCDIELASDSLTNKLDAVH